MKKFTLIELMIVVAIVGILVTLLFPSLSRAREKAKIAVCLSNQRQIATAYSMYAVRNNGLAVYSRWYQAWGGTKGLHGWCSDPRSSRPLAAYLSNGKVAWCPSENGDPLGNRAHIGRDFGESWIHSTWDGPSGVPYISKACNGYNGYANQTEDQRRVNSLYISSYDKPNVKGLFAMQILRGDRNWYNDPYKRMRWHDKKNLMETIAFADGHAVYYNWWMKLVSATYNPASGKTLQWRWDNLYLY